MLHLRQEPSGALTFWVGAAASQTAICTRS
jgi:hypothetical protein